MDFIGRVKKLIYPITSRYIKNASLFEGILKGTDQPFRCLIVDGSKYEGYVMARIFSGTPRLLKRWKIWIPWLKVVLDRYSNSIDICIAVLPSRYERHFAGLYAFKGQNLVNQIIDTSGTWEAIFKVFHQKKRQYASNVEGKFGLKYEISSNMDDFDLFYHRMHLPHIKSQFGDYAEIDSYEDMRKYFLKGFLLFVGMDGLKIAGGLCLIENGTLFFRRTGVLDGDEGYRRRGAQFALYYFIIRYAWEHGLEKVDTMKSDPFLNDGVYRTKREWGASVYPDDEAKATVLYFIPRYTTEIAYFFEHNPVVILGEDGLFGLTGCNEMCKHAMLNKQELSKKYYSPGLKGLITLASNGKKTQVQFEEARIQGQPAIVD